MKTRRHAALAVFALLAGAVALVADNGNGGQNDEVRMRATLTGPAIGGVKPEGNADFRSDSQRGRTRLNVEVEHVNMPAGTVLTVAVHQGTVTTTIGTIKLSALGEGELELNSQDGDVVPVVITGTMVTVKNPAGTTILAGVF